MKQVEARSTTRSVGTPSAAVALAALSGTFVTVTNPEELGTRLITDTGTDTRFFRVRGTVRLKRAKETCILCL